jgi:hypothetical protein
MRRCGAYAIALSHVMQKHHVRQKEKKKKKTNSASGKESAMSRASARGSDGDYKMSFRKIFTLLIRQ